MKTSIAVFDIDGTLTDSVAVHQAAFLRALEAFGFPDLETDWSSYQHHSDSAIFAEAWARAGWNGPPPLVDLEDRYREAFDEEMAKTELVEIPGAASFVRSLADSQWLPVFATGSLRHGAVRKMKAAKLPYEDAVLVTASEHQTREDIVGQTIRLGRAQLLRSQPARIVSIGDGLWDLLTAKTLDVEFIGIARGAKKAVLTGAGARVVADYAPYASPSDFFDLARKLA